MSGFLQKLKRGGVAIDNNAPPDSSGIITRRLEKHFASEPADALGLEVGPDAEVLSVTPGSLAALANIPSGFMIFDVNNDFIEANEQFKAAAGRNLNLVIKLQSVASMSELIGRILREEASASIEEAKRIIGLDELMRTTPRYGFLASDHPLFRRYTMRLRSRREAAALMRQREREAEERMQRQNRERIQKEIMAAQAEAKAAEEKQRREEEERRAAAKVAALSPEEQLAAQNQNASFIPIFEDQSTFGQLVSPEKQNVPESMKKIDSPPPAPQTIITTTTTTTTDDPVPNKVTQPAAAETTPTIPPVSTSELLALLGVPTDTVPVVVTAAAAVAQPEPPKTNNEDLPPLLEDPKDVRYVILPSEEYTLSNGEKAICSLKSRSGPFPSPPPGKPPKMSSEAKLILRQLAESCKRQRSRSGDKNISSLSSSSDDGRRKHRDDYRHSSSHRHSRHERDRRSDSHDRRRGSSRDRKWRGDSYELNRHRSSRHRRYSRH